MVARVLVFGNTPPGATAEQKLDWIISALRQIEVASQDPNAFTIARDFTVSNNTVNRALDPSSATLAEVAQVLGTLLEDQQRGGAKRTG